MSDNPIEKAKAMRILLSLSKGKKTYSELQLDARVTPKTLSRRLGELQEFGFVNRKELDSKLGEVEYSLTDKGKKLFPPLEEVFNILKEFEIEK